ncbi:hypothetical protein COV16_06640 [Candidatus Woesearchaeota archaeon CG10_big_fil_rev_8_21_14_0_10_34_8]|nr:MAG: hypothetical protein COV16_06640 [Candidatus Woesearchaeota archaeon CG10_big_fil_rev_8_21_14_0_10_34_8]
MKLIIIIILGLFLVLLLPISSAVTCSQPDKSKNGCYKSDGSGGYAFQCGENQGCICTASGSNCYCSCANNVNCKDAKCWASCTNECAGGCPKEKPDCKESDTNCQCAASCDPACGNYKPNYICVPEFSTITSILGITIVLGGAILIINSKK